MSALARAAVALAVLILLTDGVTAAETGGLIPFVAMLITAVSVAAGALSAVWLTRRGSW